MSQLFVSTINLRGRDRRAIDAGQTFESEQMVLDTFKKLLEQGLIKEYAPGIVLVGVRGSAGGKRIVGPPINTPVDAVHPPKTSRKVPENRTPEQEEERLKTLAELNGMGIKAQSNMRLDTATAKLVEAKTERAAKAAKRPVRVWDFEPARLAEMADERLQAMYKERCGMYNLDVESITDRELLIAKMSSEHAL